MKILIVRNYATEVSNSTYNLQEIGLAKALIKQGHQCDVLYYSKKNNACKVIEVEGYGDYRIYYSRGFRILDNVIYVSKVFESFFSNYDIIQSNEYNHLMSAVLSILHPNKLVIYHGPYTSGSTFKRRIYNRIYNFLFQKLINQNAKILLTKSELSTGYLRRINFNKVFTVGVGLDEGKLSDKKAEYINPKNFRLLYVGVLDDRKNIKFLLELFKYLCSLDDQLELVLVGTGSSSEINNFKEFVRNNSLESKVFFKGAIEQKNIGSEYLNSDLFILPSKEEIFGMSMLEAMYFGLPVATTVHGGSSTVIKDDINGLIFEDFDISNWAKRILELKDNIEKCKLISNNASELIKNEYIWEKRAKKFIEYYNMKLKISSGEKK